MISIMFLFKKLKQCMSESNRISYGAKRNAFCSAETPINQEAPVDTFWER